MKIIFVTTNGRNLSLRLHMIRARSREAFYNGSSTVEHGLTVLRFQANGRRPRIGAGGGIHLHRARRRLQTFFRQLLVLVSLPCANQVPGAGKTSEANTYISRPTPHPPGGKGSGCGILKRRCFQGEDSVCAFGLCVAMVSPSV